MSDLHPPRVQERCPTCGQPLVMGVCTLCGAVGRRPPPTDEPDAPAARQPDPPVAVHNDGVEPTRPAIEALVPRDRTQTVLALTIGLLIVTLLLSLFTFLKVSDLENKVKADRATQSADNDRLTIVEGAQKNLADDQQSLHSQLDAAAAADPTVIASRVQGSVYTVQAGNSLGSAWVAASDHVTAKFVTNYHVIADAWEHGATVVKVFQDQGQVYDGTIEQALPDVDLALISVPADIPKLKESNETPRPGETIIVIGSPLGFGGSVSTGTVAALREEAGINYIQFSAPISPGNSGGPVVNSLGDVIGITELDFGRVVQGAENAKFAIPVNLVCIKMHVC